MRRTTLNDGQRSFTTPLRRPNELAAALSMANERFTALARATKTAASELYWRLEMTRQQRDHLSATLVDVQSKLQVHENRNQELAGRVMALDKEVKQAEAEIAGLSLKLEASEQRRQQLEGVGEEVAQLKGELLDIRHLLERANAALAQAEHERNAARAETQTLRAEVTALLTTALTSLQQKDQSSGKPPNAGLAPSGDLVKAPVPNSPEAQDREAGL